MYSNGPRLKSKQSQSIHKINNQYDTLISIYLIWSKPATRKKKVLMQVSNAWLLRGRNNALIVELLLMIISKKPFVTSIMFYHNIDTKSFYSLEIIRYFRSIVI